MWFTLALALLPFSLGKLPSRLQDDAAPGLTLISAVNTIYWPVTSPSHLYPWVTGGTNLLAWTSGGGTGIESFDIQLHNGNRSIMTGFIPIALRVPMERLPSGRKNFGGEMEVQLDTNIPTG